jgi:hypothetical protein
VTKAERLDALLARLEGLPARISALTLGIGHLRARRGEKDDGTWTILQSLQDKARALGDEMFELWLEIGQVRDGRRRRAAPDRKPGGAPPQVSRGPRLGRRVPADELQAVLRSRRKHSQEIVRRIA